MEDEGKTKEQLMNELTAMHQRVAELEKSENDHKLAEEALCESEEMFRLFMEHSPIYVFFKDEQIRPMQLSKNYEKMLGRSIHELIGKTMYDLFPSELAQSMVKDDLRILNEGKPIEVEEKLNGRFYRTTKFPIVREGKPPRLAGFTMDITEAKLAEEALRESEARFRSYFELPLIGIAITSPEKGWIEVNDQICSMMGYSREELLRTTWAELTHPEDLVADVEQFNQVLAGHVDSYSMDKRFIRKNGEVLWASIAVGCVRDSGGMVKYIVALALDITERRRVEKVLQESEARYRELAESISDVFFAMDRDLRYTYWNKASEKLTGIAAKDAIGKSLSELFPDEAGAKAARVYLEVLRTQQPQNFVNDYRFHGKDFFFEISAYPSSAGLSVFVKDITERKRTEVELKKSYEQIHDLVAHLETIREEERTLVAREIHDELGQALTALKMDLDWLERKIPNDQTTLLEGITTMSKMTDTTLDMVKKISADLRPGVLDDFGIGAAIEWQLQEFQNRTGIDCEASIDPEEMTSDKNLRTAIFRIFQEAMTNVARHANATRVEVSLEERENQVVLTVKDNGKGINEEKISDRRSFGLLGIRERVYANGGSLKISGVQGKGTTLIVEIPARKGE